MHIFVDKSERNQHNPNTSRAAEVLIAAHMLRVNYLAKRKLLSDLETFDLGFEAKGTVLFAFFSSGITKPDLFRFCCAFLRQVLCNVRVTLIDPWQQVEQVSGM